MKWKPAKPVSFGWKMKGLESAVTSFRVLDKGSYEAVIHHDVIKGCTVEMIEWWFRNIGGTMEYRGRVLPKYRVWHPADHIHWELAKGAKDGKAGAGARFRIVEAFGGKKEWLIDTVEEVVKLDKTGIRLRRKFLGIEVSSLEHWFEPHEAGTTYRSRLQVGSETLIGRYLFNPVIHRFFMNKGMCQAWLQHNIEEVGNFEYFLPRLYRQATGAGKSLGQPA